MKPIKIEAGEWMFKGCFIQQQFNPLLPKYHIFQDTKEQLTVGTSYTFTEAKKIAALNFVKHPLHTLKDFLKLCLYLYMWNILHN